MKTWQYFVIEYVALVCLAYSPSLITWLRDKRIKNIDATEDSEWERDYIEAMNELEKEKELR